MTAKLKQLNETVGALKKEIRTHLDSPARTAMTAEQRGADAKLIELESKFAASASDFDAEFRQAARESGTPLALTTAETRTVERFNLGRVVNHLHASARGGVITALDGVEAELLQEGQREAHAAGIESSGVMLPRALVRRGVESRDMTAGTAGEGGNTITTTKAGLLDDFFAASVLRAAGATVLENLVGNLDIPRLAAGTAPAGKAENANADEVSPTTAMLSMTPKRLPAYIDISERLLRQNPGVLEAVIRRHLSAQMASVQEAAFFHGAGSVNAAGIAGTVGIGSVAGGTDGLAPTQAHIIGLETAVDTANALLGNLRYISNGQIRGKLKQTLRNSSGTDASYILTDAGMINGYSPLFTNAVSRTLTKGNQSLSSAIFFGNFADYYIGYWGGVSLEMIRDKPNAIAGLYTLVASAYYDGGVVRPKSFSAMLDALGA